MTTAIGELKRLVKLHGQGGSFYSDIVKSLKKLEWSGSEGCAGLGFMGSGSPMHQHPSCPACRGGAGKYEDQRCFNEQWFGHKRSCWLAKAIR